MAGRTVSVVFNTEEDELELLGTFVGAIEDAIGYKSTAGVTHYAPYDCVAVVSLACFDIGVRRFWAVRHGA